MSNMRKFGTCLTMVALAVLALIVVMPDAYAAPLTVVTDTPDSDIAGATTTHEIAFTTATVGTIASVDITFPAGFDVSGVAVTAGAQTVIGDASTVVAVDGVVTYTVASPAEVSGSIMIPLTGVVNAPAGEYTALTVETKDDADATIDGPTALTTPLTIGPAVFAVAVAPAIEGATATHTVSFPTLTTGKIASVDITFPIGFDFSGPDFDVGTVTPAAIDGGSVTTDGQVVTYTVTPAVEVMGGIYITIPLEGVINATAGNYTVTIETKDATPATIDGPTESDPFTITTPGSLTDVTVTLGDDEAGAATTHTIAFTTETTATIASVDITYFDGFDLSGVAVTAGTQTGIGDASTVEAVGQVVTYTVGAPDEVAADTDITIPLTGVVNDGPGTYTVTVATKDVTAIIDGPTESAQFTIEPSGDAGVWFSQLSVYDLNQADHYDNKPGVYPDDYDAKAKTDPYFTGAIKRGSNNVPILKIMIEPPVDAEWNFTGLKLRYVGASSLDIGTTCSIYETTYEDGDEDGDGVPSELISGTFVSLASFVGSDVTFYLGEIIPKDGTGTYVVVLDIKPNAGSNRVDLRVLEVNETEVAETPIIDDAVIHKPNPPGYGWIDAKKPTLDLVEYDKGTKVLTMVFKDSAVVTGEEFDTRINVVDRSDGKATWKVDLSKLRIQDEDDKNQIDLDSAKFLYPDYPGGYPDYSESPPDAADYEIPSTDLRHSDKAIDTNDPTSIWYQYPYPLGDDTRVNRADQINPRYAGVVKIKLTSGQGADFENKLKGKTPELDILANALMDYVFDNQIAEDLNNSISIVPPEGDIVPPSLLTNKDKPVKFDYVSKVLTLDFNETIDAITTNAVNLSKIYIMNYKIEEEVVDDTIIEHVVIDPDFVMSLRGDVTKVYGTTLMIKLTEPKQIDVLKGDHAQLYLDAGAVKDVAGNGNLALNADGMDNDGTNGINEGGSISLITKFLDRYIDDYLTAHPDLVGYGDNLIDAANVYVTPPLLSGVETLYNANTPVAGFVPSPLPFDLKFSEEIGTVDATKITITNEDGGASFKFTSSEFDTINDDQDGIVRIVTLKVSKTDKDKISAWQKDEDITQLHVTLDAGAVVDIYGSSNELMTVSERIHWQLDDTGPVLMTSDTTYDQSKRSLSLHFDEQLDLTLEGDETLEDLVMSELITLSPPDSRVTGTAFPLTNDELVPNQADNWYLKYTLTSTQNDEISKWQAQISELNDDPNINIPNAIMTAITSNEGAVNDVNENPAVVITKHVTLKNLKGDTAKPTFKAAYYSVELKLLVIRFGEAIVTNADTVNSIKVHAAGKDPVDLGDDAGIKEVSGEALTIEGLSDDAHKAIANVGNPQVDILVNAVSDLAGNKISAFTNRPITYDEGGPSLSVTGNTYKHIWDETKTPPNQGLLTLKFNEIVDVDLIDLAKIKLQAGTTIISLLGVTTKTEKDASKIEIEISDEDMVTVGEIAGLQSEYYPDDLFVVLEAEAVKDLAGNYNIEQSMALEEWIGDTQNPELNYTTSYYIHDKLERSKHYARLVLKFDELMETSAEYIDFSGIVVANDAGDSITLTAEELVPDQDLSKEIQFNLTDDHRDTISDWGKPADPDPIPDPLPADYKSFGAGKGDTELHVYLAEGSVSDRAGNSVVVKPVQKFAVASADLTDVETDLTNLIDERTYPNSTWEKDLKGAGYVSSTYNAEDKWMTITFDESMDQTPKDTTVQPELVTIKDKDEENTLTLTAGAADWSEQAKTKTVKFKVQPVDDIAIKERANDIVGQSATKVYMYLAEGVAVDFGGVPSAVANKKAITYTRDTQKPVLVVSDAGSEYYHKLDVPVGDDLGLLTLYFDEGVDKNYDAIDATKISLSNTSSGGGFALTQAEIFTAAGFRVYPLAAVDVNKIQFDLNTEHWDIIADEKWSKMYIRIEAGAVKDTSGNAIAAVDAVMHDARDHYDETIPVVELTPIVSTAPAGKDLTIKAKVTDDISVQKVRLYYQGGGAIPTFMVMTNTTGDTYEATIPASAVTNKGLCYYVWVEDQAGNDNINADGNIITKGGDWWYTSIPGGFNVEVTDASVELPAGTLPVFDQATVPSTYRMISVPINASPTSTALFTPFGVAGIDWLAWRFDGGAANNGYQAGHEDSILFSPGIAAWVGTVNPNEALMATGKTIQISDHLDDIPARGRYIREIELHAGWNQIGNLFNFSRNWDKDTIYDSENDNIKDEIYWFTGEKGSYSFASLDPNVPNQDVFETSWIGSGVPDNPQVWRGWPGSIDPWGGYWIYSNKEGAKLKIDPTVPGKGVLPSTPSAPSAQMPYNWSVKVMPEASGVFGTAKFAGIVSDATDGIDNYDVMDLPPLPGQVARLAFITEDGDYLQDMKAPADEMFWNFKASAAVNTPVTLRFDPSAVPSEYRTVLLIDTVTEAATDLRKASSYAYKSSEKIRNFKLIISKAHIETYIVPKHSVLLQNYPNPFNPETWVPYRLSTAGDVTLNIYNVAGQLVRTLELGHREAGSYTAKERSAYWDGRNATGERVASGVYFYNIQSGSFHATKRMVIVK